MMDIAKHLREQVREQAIVCGFYLSRYDEEGLKLMGFQSFQEAYNVLGFSIGAKPASIKNYRDEFDPLFPNLRKGWHGRALRTHCARVYENFKEYDIHEMLSIIARITGCAFNISSRMPEDPSESFAKRILTGRAAENFFSKNYRKEREFSDTKAEDVTHTGCGYDFRLRRPGCQNIFAVEVKGLTAMSGNIALTHKEHDVAEKLADNYFIYLVRNFCEQPFATTIRNPICAGLAFKKEERKIIQIFWSAKI